MLISTTTGDNYYWFAGTLPQGAASSAQARKPKQLNRLKGAVIESVAWSSAPAGPSSVTFSTREILLGTLTGQVLETTLLDPALAESSSFSLPVPGNRAVERYVKLLYTLPEREPISGLRCETWGKRAAVVATTASRIYQFIGTLGGRKEDDSSLLEPALQPYASGDAQPKSLELPGDGVHSELHFFASPKTFAWGAPAGVNLPKSVAWLTGPGIYHGTLSFPSPSSDHLHPGDGVIESASLVPYPSEPTSPTKLSSSAQHNAQLHKGDDRTNVPISMALTEWHFVLLYEDRIRVIGLLSDMVVHEELLDLPPGARPLKLSTDPIRKTCWMHTDQSIHELVIKDEDRDVWKIYLQRSNYDLAKRFAKTQTQRDTVLAAEADAYFAAGRFIPSAQSYAQSSKPFEEVVLRFVDKGERDALRYYLVAKLERLKRTDIIQRMMLATWLVEIFLSKMNELEDVIAAERVADDAESLAVEKAMLEDDLRQFLTTYQANLDPNTMFDLLAKHGRDDVTLFYASIVGNHDRIVTHWVLEENWTKALEALNGQDSVELYYKFAPVLVREAPKEAIEGFMRQPKLDVRRLIPALSPPQRPGAGKKARWSSQDVIKYLEYSILQLQCTDAAVHNTLLTLFASDPTAAEADLLHFLAVSPDNALTGQPYYDLDYALRLCRAHKRVQACVLIYSKMGLYEASVDLALAHDDLDLAKFNADRPTDDDLLRKKLWLKIARYVVGQKNDIKEAMRFLDQTDLLKIEDVLPFFPDFVVIDDYADSICSALEGYSAHIERLKEDMDDATRSAEAIRGDIAELKNRFVVVDAGEKCAACGLPLLTRQFYVFPCQHTFHADCLIQEVTQNLSPVQLRRMIDLQAKLAPAAAKSPRPRRVKDAVEDGAREAGREGLKLAVAGVQGLDQLRKLVLPDALLGAIGGAIPGLPGGGAKVGFGAGTKGVASGGGGQFEVAVGGGKEEVEKSRLREQLDDLVAGSCVLCEGAVGAVDRPFMEEGEEM